MWGPVVSRVSVNMCAHVCVDWMCANQAVYGHVLFLACALVAASAYMFLTAYPRAPPCLLFCSLAIRQQLLHAAGTYLSDKSGKASVVVLGPADNKDEFEKEQGWTVLDSAVSEAANATAAASA